MKKFIGYLLLLLLGWHASTQPASALPVPKNMVSVTVEAGMAGMGVQLLLDSKATVHGTVFSGDLLLCKDITATYYDVFDYKIPENADAACPAQYMVTEGSATIQIPAGIYDLYVINPDPSFGLYVVADASHPNGYADDFKFEAGKKYTFKMVGYTETELTVEDDLPVDAPAAVAALTFTPDISGALTAELSWKNPDKNLGASDLKELTAVRIYENDGENPIHTVSNPVIGATDSYTVTVGNPGMYHYTISAENAEGATSASTEERWIGPDVPGAPLNVTLTNNNGIAQLSWEAPDEGLHGGYLPSESISYDVYRMPGEIKVASNLTSLTFSEPTNPNMISYKVIARNSAGEGGKAMSEVVGFCRDAAINVFPWIDGFERQTIDQTGNQPLSCWTTVNGDLDGISWGQTFNEYDNHSGLGAAIHGFSYSTAQEGWLISPAVEIPATGIYMLRFWSRMATNGMNEPEWSVWISETDKETSSFSKAYVLKGTDISGEWVQIEQVLSAYAGKTIYIAFKFTGTNNGTWCIDDVSVERVAELDAAVARLYGALTPMVGQPFRYKTFVKNEGGDPLNGYTVKLVEEGGNVLVSDNTGMEIVPNSSRMIEFIWTPTTAGPISLQAVVEMPGDNDASNDESAALSVTVQTANEVYSGTIGSGTSSQNNHQLPFNVYNQTGVSQSLYLDHELVGKPAAITEVAYFNNFTEAVNNKRIRIYMANTDSIKMENWVPEVNYTLVYEGTVDFPKGKNTISIPLDQPYIYTGGNLAILTENIMDTQTYAMTNVFEYTEDNDFPGRGLYYESRSTAFDWTQEATVSNKYPKTVLKMNLEGGAISGTVMREGQPVEGVSVSILGSYQKLMTDVDGKFVFGFLPPGNYKLVLSKHGYKTDTCNPITVAANQTATANLSIEPLLQHTVSGMVTTRHPDNPKGLAGVKISLSGYDEVYTAVSDKDGNYTIPSVYGEKTYQIEARLSGYQVYRDIFDVMDNDLTLNFSLSDVAYAVVDPSVTVSGANTVVRWKSPIAAETYTLDDGTAELGFWTSPGKEGWLGNKFEIQDKSGVLTSVDIYGFASGSLQIKPLTVDIFDGDMTLVGSSQPFMLPNNDWINVPLQNIPYSEVFLCYGALGCPKHTYPLYRL